MNNSGYIIMGGLSVIGLIASSVVFYRIGQKVSNFLSDYLEDKQNKTAEKALIRLYKKCAAIVYARSKKELVRRGQLEVNNMALILEEVKQIDKQTYDELVVRLAKSIRKEEVKQGLAKATELTELPSFFGDDSEDDLIDFN